MDAVTAAERSRAPSPPAPTDSTPVIRPGALAHAGRLVSRAEIALLVLIVLVAGGVRFLPLQRGLGFDELFTAVNFVTAESAWETASTSINFNNHVGYSLLARLSVAQFGRSEWALRLPALLLGLAALPLLWRLARPVVGPAAALAATLGLALVPDHVLWSTSARGYAGLLFGVLLATGLLFRLLARPSAVLAGGLALVTALTAYLHLYAVPVAIVQGGFLLVVLAWASADDQPSRRRRAAWLGLVALAGAGLLTVLLYLPILPSLLHSIQHAGRGTFWPGFAWSVAQELTGVTPDALVTPFLLVAAVGAVLLGRARPWIVGYALAIGLLPLLAATLARPADLYARFFVYALPFLLVALVAGGSAPAILLARRLPGRLAVLAWCPTAAGALLVLWVWAGQYSSFAVDEGFRAAVRALEADAGEGTALCATGAGAELFQWYAARPLAFPKTVNELRQATRGADEVRCVARPTSWESRSTAEVRRYLEERGTVERFGDIVLYRTK